MFVVNTRRSKMCFNLVVFHRRQRGVSHQKKKVVCWKIGKSRGVHSARVYLLSFYAFFCWPPTLKRSIKSLRQNMKSRIIQVDCFCKICIVRERRERKKLLLCTFLQLLEHISKKRFVGGVRSAGFAPYILRAFAAARSNYNAIVTLPSQWQLLILSCFRNGKGKFA